MVFLTRNLGPWAVGPGNPLRPKARTLKHQACVFPYTHVGTLGRGAGGPPPPPPPPMIPGPYNHACPEDRTFDNLFIPEKEKLLRLVRSKLNF